MTEKEVLKLALEALELHGKQYPHMVKGYCLDAITAIKEALAQPEQEPVATVTSESGHPDVTMSWWHEPALPVGTPLYTTPPQRKPLADEEILEIARDHYNPHQRPEISFARAIEAKLKEQNT